MSRLSQKIIAVLFAIWLPLFSGSALAASVSMQMSNGQMPAGHCQDESMQMAEMGDMDMHSMSDADHQTAPACDLCGLCHMACTAYLVMPNIALMTAQTVASDSTPYAFSFHTISFTPLLPPPLARV
jgi:hypothetical protein